MRGVFGLRNLSCRVPLLAAAVAVLLPAAGANAQQGPMIREAIQRKLAAIKESAAANKAALRQYAWTETVVITAGGEARPAKQFMCKYGPDGNVVRTPTGPPQEQQKAGPLKQRMMEKAKDEFEAEMQKIRATIGLYVPPDGQKMEQAFQAGNANIDRPGAGEGGLDFKNYAKPGDSMALDFNMNTKKLAALNVNSYLDDPSQAIALAAQFASLPDGTNYPGTITLQVPSKKLQVAITNSNYQKVGGP
jgi:hypothetical protein